MFQLTNKSVRLTECLLPWIQRRFSSNIQPINMAFTSYGSNQSLPPVIILHGLFGSQRNWRTVARELNNRLENKIYTADTRNHGESPHTDTHGSPYIAADIKELLKNEGHQKACLMGHSMGGRAVMYFALHNPEYVDRAIIIDISPIAVPRDFSHMENILTAMQNISISPKESLLEGRKIAAKQISDAVGSRTTVDFILMNLTKRKNGEFYWIPNIPTLQKNMRLFSMESFERLPPYKGRAMFICGNQSNFVDPEQWPDIQKIFPNSELHWLDASHLVHFDQPQKFMELVATFLKQ